MRRNAITAAAAGALAVGLFLVLSREPTPAARPPADRADSVWYHASDVALLARTGRPQLVEFFHPD
jgi:hypothetical protein